MTSEDFVKIFYSNFAPNIDWTNIEEIKCADTNALKLEKYLALSTTKKILVLPYPHSGDVKVFEFVANPRFFEYIKHKESFLNRENAKFR